MSFVKIESVFQRERNVDELSKVYQDKSFLKKKILRVGKGIIDNKSIIGNKKILLKPNWVLHDRNDSDQISLRTNDSFLIAIVELLIELGPKEIIIGDAPVQSCDWNRMVTNKFLLDIEELREKYKVPIIIKDFRRVTFDPKQNNPVKNRNPISNYLIFDLGKKSYLEPISSSVKNVFRVTSYSPDQLAKSHTKGIHKYCITKEVFDSDVVISIPKIKTHQKTGITCALKNIVGLNGDKDYLPHHRIGGTSLGGDCYPGNNRIRLVSEYLLDIANRRQGRTDYKFWSYLSAAFWKLTFPKKVHNLTAAWHGNDTTWRMVLDLNKIAIYGKKDGSLADVPQRTLFSLCDGIIGGQGNGPLNPEPLPLGVISFTNNSGLNDICMATLMGYDYKRIPLLSAVYDKTDQEIMFNGKKINFKDLDKYSILTKAPPGWQEHLM